jgi:hypothetical protein
MRAFRVLKPGGRFAVSEVVADGPVPTELRQNVEAWVGCLAAARAGDPYTALLTEAGPEEVSMAVSRRYIVAETGRVTTTLPAGWEAGDGKLAGSTVLA